MNRLKRTNIEAFYYWNEETNKMLKALEDHEGVDRNGNPKKNFVYTLQNIAITAQVSICDRHFLIVDL